MDDGFLHVSASSRTSALRRARALVSFAEGTTQR
jgi:hypothetical protein